VPHGGVGLFQIAVLPAPSIQASILKPMSKGGSPQCPTEAESSVFSVNVLDFVNDLASAFAQSIR